MIGTVEPSWCSPKSVDLEKDPEVPALASLELVAELTVNVEAHVVVGVCQLELHSPNAELATRRCFVVAKTAGRLRDDQLGEVLRHAGAYWEYVMMMNGRPVVRSLIGLNEVELAASRQVLARCLSP